MSIKRVAVTGASGQIAYNLLFRIISGDLLGINQPIALHLLEIPEMVNSLRGLVLELEDCSCPLLKEIHYGSDPVKGFEEADYAILIGSKPRGPGMERKELLAENGKIFLEQGKALNQVAKSDVIVFVVGNPCNTNSLIALSHAIRLNPKRFHAMTRLDQNRAVFQLAHKAGVPVSDVKRMTIWGNHSSTQVPDFVNARIHGKPVMDVIHDKKWLEEEFINTIQKRGAAVIAARGKSSAGSASQAILDGMRSIIFPTPPDEWFSSAILSDGNPYGIEAGLVFSFPCRSHGNGHVDIVPGLEWNHFLKKKIDLTCNELLEEKQMVGHLL